MTARPAKGWAVYDGRGSLIWGTLATSALEAERRYRRWNAVEQFPESFTGWTVQAVTITPEAPARRRLTRCADTAEMFPGILPERQ